ncbi:hypothetical protein FOL47_004399 [Perkinsus chesapeaki]|uniref:Uncharacterized protein n=1 Tax=Perkinsus chesapeaki TaxID=330153 RepID=A0A7J6N0E2_PERCH|nr:hypothetical protein FOL47_004399 [Perkinsus chesapeaki]
MRSLEAMMANILIGCLGTDLSELQILYADLDEDVHFFLFPAGQPLAAYTRASAEEAGVLISSKTQKLFFGKPSEVSLSYADFLVAEEIRNTERVKDVSVLRVQGKITEEYYATIPGDRECLEIRHLAGQSAEITPRGFQFRLEPKLPANSTKVARVQEEVNDLCDRGFYPLKPLDSYNMLASGDYEGERSADFGFKLRLDNNGKGHIVQIFIDTPLPSDYTLSEILFRHLCNTLITTVQAGDGLQSRMAYHLVLRPSGNPLQTPCTEGAHYNKKTLLKCLRDWNTTMTILRPVIRRTKERREEIKLNYESASKEYNRDVTNFALSSRRSGKKYKNRRLFREKLSTVGNELDTITEDSKEESV